VDDVETDEPEPVGREPRRHPAADLAVPRVDLGALDTSPDVDVPPVLVLLGDARDGAEWLAGEDDDALVALRAHAGEIALRHHEAGPVGGRDLEDRVQIPVTATEMEDAGAATAVERLDDHLAPEVLEEGLQADGVRAHEAVRHDVGEVQRVEL